MLKGVFKKGYENQFQNMTERQSNELLKLLQNFKELFDGTLGTWEKDQLYLEL